MGTMTASLFCPISVNAESTTHDGGVTALRYTALLKFIFALSIGNWGAGVIESAPTPQRVELV